MFWDPLFKKYNIEIDSTIQYHGQMRSYMGTTTCDFFLIIIGGVSAML